MWSLKTGVCWAGGGASVYPTLSVGKKARTHLADMSTLVLGRWFPSLMLVGLRIWWAFACVPRLSTPLSGSPVAPNLVSLGLRYGKRMAWPALWGSCVNHTCPVTRAPGEGVLVCYKASTARGTLSTLPRLLPAPSGWPLRSVMACLPSDSGWVWSGEALWRDWGANMRVRLGPYFATSSCWAAGGSGQWCVPSAKAQLLAALSALVPGAEGGDSSASLGGFPALAHTWETALH